MKIKTLKCANFKGGNLLHEFGDINLIVGQNFMRKSAIPQAIEVANYGALLSVGETNAATFRLSSDASELFTRVTFDNGDMNTFALSKDASGSIKSSYERAHNFPKVLIDVQEYLSLSEQERLKYVLKRANLKKCGYDEAELRKLMFHKDAKASDKTKAVIADWEKEWTEALAQCKETKSSVMDFMDALLQRLKKRISEVTAKLKVLKAQGKAIELSTTEPVDVSDERNKAYEDLCDLRNATKIAQDDKLEDLEGDLDRAEEDLGDVEEKIEDLEREEKKMRTHKSCPTCKAEGNDWLKPWLKQHAPKLADAKHELEKARTTVAKLKRAVEQAKNKVPKQTPAQEKALKMAQERFDELDSQYEDFVKWKGDQDRLNEIKAQVVGLITEEEAIDGMVKALVAYQRDMVEKAFKALIMIASQFTAGLITGDLAYQDGQLGYKRGQQFVHHSVMSGTEKLLTYAGLQIALSQESPCKYVVLDEMGRVHPDLKPHVIARLISLVGDGTLDQCFLIDTTAKDYESFVSRKLVKLINLI